MKITLVKIYATVLHLWQYFDKQYSSENLTSILKYEEMFTTTFDKFQETRNINPHNHVWQLPINFTFGWSQIP